MTKKTSITTKILIAMAIGLVTGSLINTFANDIAFIQDYLVNGLFHVVGSAFVNALKNAGGASGYFLTHWWRLWHW